jgi:hypothetical protein
MKSSFLFIIYYTRFIKSFFFCKIIYKKKKPFSKRPKGLEIDKLPLLDTFRTFCWGKIIEELQNINKLKELISVPASSVSSI